MNYWRKMLLLASLGTWALILETRPPYDQNQHHSPAYKCKASSIHTSFSHKVLRPVKEHRLSLVSAPFCLFRKGFLSRNTQSLTTPLKQSQIFAATDYNRTNYKYCTQIKNWKTRKTKFLLFFLSALFHQ